MGTDDDDGDDDDGDDGDREELAEAGPVDHICVEVRCL